jgi:hypothetical protein
MGFSAMLAEEHILHRYIAVSHSSGQTNKFQQKNLTSTSVFQSASVVG